MATNEMMRAAMIALLQAEQAAAVVSGDKEAVDFWTGKIIEAQVEQIESGDNSANKSN